MEAVQSGVQPGQVAGGGFLGRRLAPVVKPGGLAQPVGQAVGDGEATGALQLGQDDYHLPAKFKLLNVEFFREMEIVFD